VVLTFLWEPSVPLLRVISHNHPGSLFLFIFQTIGHGIKFLDFLMVPILMKSILVI
jgi:hypothetical protein